MPFEVRRRDGLLVLTLDTPGSPINVFNHATAQQLVDILGQIDPADTRAVVFRTAKRNSFINGVGLLLAHASQTVADVEKSSAPAWAAYLAVRNCVVPTAAVIEGNCFGCGVEFALNCSLRIAVDRHETQFYMTELNDYLFMPLFGGTWNLPATVGLGDAIDLLLWGERWTARRAAERGLVDLLVAPDDEAAIDAELRRVVAAASLARPSRQGRDDQVVAAAHRRIEQLPPVYQPLYGAALDLLVRGAERVGTYEEHQRRELACSAASALAPEGKAAYGFFYLRQMASQRVAGRFDAAAPPVRLSLDPGLDRYAPELAAALRRSSSSAVTFVSPRHAEFEFVAGEGAANAAAVSGTVAVRVGLRTAASDTVGAGVQAYFPAFAGERRLVELLVPREPEGGVAPASLLRLATALQRLGYEVVRTSAAGRPVSDRLLLAYLAPLVVACRRGLSAPVIDATLRHFGFVRRASLLVAEAGLNWLAGALLDVVGGERDELAATLGRLAATPSPGVVPSAPTGDAMDAVALSLLAEILALRDAGAIRDVVIADVIAREALDFPRHLGSLCTWLKRDRIELALTHESSVRELVGDRVWRSSVAFAAGGREFYR